MARALEPVWNRLEAKPGLVGPGILSDAVDKYGNTILHLAVAAGRLDLLLLGLQEGVDPDKKNNVGKTAEMIAVMKHNWMATKILMDSKARKKVSSTRKK
jgi:ankyrin repeat protein